MASLSVGFYKERLDLDLVRLILSVGSKRYSLIFQSPF